MTDTLFSDLRSAEALQTYVLETGPVLTLRLDSQERVVEANALALRLFGEEIVGRPLADLIAHCSGSFALDWPALGDGRISRLTFKTVSQMPETLYFRFFPLQTGALALGSIDFDEQQKLLAGLEALNAELSGLARQLQQANAELRDLSEFKTRAVQKMQEDNEALRRQGLASLNLMEDALESRERAEKANHALRESEQQFRSLVEGAPDTIFVVTDLVISYINPAGCRLFGASSPEQLLNQPVFDRIHPSSQDQVRARIHKVFHQKEPASSSEQLWITLDGTLVPLEVSSVPITYRGKDSALTYARDLSERHRAKEELRRSEDRYRSILEAAPDAIVMLNADGKIVLVNSQAESMFGYSREALLGRDSASLFAERYRHLHLQRRELFFENSLNQPQGAVVENFGLRADGTEFPIEYRTSPLEDQDGKRQLAVFRDVTERRDSEQRSRQLEIKVAEAEAANKAKSVFLSTMSHEIRTPMNAILGYSQLMLRDPRLHADAKTNLKIINRSGEHLLDIINDILDMAKIEAGRLILSAKLFDIRSLLNDLANMFRLRAEAKGLQFEVITSGEPLSKVIADEGKIRQVLINLLGNAIKFTQRGRVGLLVRVSRERDGRILFSAAVEDTGIGLTQQEQSELFQPFAQTQSGQQNQHGGTGLGLAISRGIARLMGGDITVTSQPGRGSTFLLEIPVQRGAADDIPSNKTVRRRVLSVEPGKDAPRILIADDMPESRDWLSQLLTGLGFSVRTAENGEAAVLAWEDWRPAMVLMDMHMPVMDGLEAARRIRLRPAGKDTVIVALTADAMEAHRRVVLEHDLDDFMSKPCVEAELLEKIRTHLDLEYVYASETADEEAEPADDGKYAAPDLKQPAELPADLVPRMREAVRQGDKALLDTLILAIEQRGDPQSAGALRELADMYQYEKLMEVLAEHAAPSN